jgi:hypothetical protein
LPSVPLAKSQKAQSLFHSKKARSDNFCSDYII